MSLKLFPAIEELRNFVENFSTTRVGIAQSLQWLATGWTIGWSGFDSRRGLGIYFFDIMSRPALGPIRPPIHWAPGALSLGVRLITHHKLVPSLKNAWSYISAPPLHIKRVVLS